MRRIGFATNKLPKRTLHVRSRLQRCRYASVSNGSPAPTTAKQPPKKTKPVSLYNVEYERMYRQSIEQPDKFWGQHAESVHWYVGKECSFPLSLVPLL